MWYKQACVMTFSLWCMTLVHTMNIAWQDCKQHLIANYHNDVSNIDLIQIDVAGQAVFCLRYATGILYGCSTSIEVSEHISVNMTMGDTILLRSAGAHDAVSA